MRLPLFDFLPRPTKHKWVFFVVAIVIGNNDGVRVFYHWNDNFHFKYARTHAHTHSLYTAFWCNQTNRGLLFMNVVIYVHYFRIHTHSFRYKMWDKLKFIPIFGLRKSIEKRILPESTILSREIPINCMRLYAFNQLTKVSERCKMDVLCVLNLIEIFTPKTFGTIDDGLVFLCLLVNIDSTIHFHVFVQLRAIEPCFIHVVIYVCCCVVFSFSYYVWK